MTTSAHQSIKNVTIESKKIKKKTIESFLYTSPPPKPKAIQAVPIIKQAPKEEVKPFEIKEKLLTEQQLEVKKESDKKIIESKKVNHTTTLEHTVKEATVVKKQVPVKKLSAYEQLQQLNRSIANQHADQGAEEYFQPRSLSKMHKQPYAVPTSIVPPTAEEKRKANTQQLSGDLAVIKGDDGTCYVERDLAVVGIEGVKSRESFDCGQSKFDRAFKAHMKKAMNKHKY